MNHSDRKLHQDYHDSHFSSQTPTKSNALDICKKMDLANFILYSRLVFLNSPLEIG